MKNTGLVNIDRIIADLARSQKETNDQLKKTEKAVENLSKETGKITDGWGKFVEGLVTPSIPVLFKKFGIVITGSSQRAERRRNGEELEIDILAVGRGKGRKEVVVAVEVKSNLKISDIDDHVEDLRRFFDFFEEYRGRTLIGAVAGIRMDEGAMRYAEKKGLYVLAPSGDIMVLLNHPGFKPKVW